MQNVLIPANARFESRINLDKLELEYNIPIDKLQSIQTDGFASDYIVASPTLKQVPHYKFTMDLYYDNHTANLFDSSQPRTIFVGQMYWETTTQFRHNVYVMLNNKVLYDSELKTYLTAVDSFVKQLGGHYNKIMKLEIAEDCNVNLIKRFESLTQKKQPSILHRGKVKQCNFMFNGKATKQHKDNEFLKILCSGSTENPYKTKTIYISGSYWKTHPQMELKIYNKSREVQRNGNAKDYILDYFLGNRNNVYRFEVAFKSPYLIKKSLESVFNCQPNYIDFLCSKSALQKLMSCASLKLFSARIKVNHEAFRYEFMELVKNDSVIL